jgi:3-oxoadipate CoA-transferase alpha subunit
LTNKLFPTFQDAVADIPNGASIMFGGFATAGVPFNLLRALYEQGATDLTLIANSGAAAREGMITAANLIDERRVRKVVFAFTAGTHPSRPVQLQVLEEAGLIEAELVPQGTLAERIRAAGAGIPAFYTPTSVGTALAEGKEHREFDGRSFVMERALPADYALVRARKADEFGNLQFRQSARNFNPIMAMAATCTIVEAEDVVPTGSIDPDFVHTSGVYVHRVVKIPPDGILHVNPRIGD